VAPLECASSRRVPPSAGQPHARATQPSLGRVTIRLTKRLTTRTPRGATVAQHPHLSAGPPHVGTHKAERPCGLRLQMRHRTCERVSREVHCGGLVRGSSRPAGRARSSTFERGGTSRAGTRRCPHRDEVVARRPRPRARRLQRSSGGSAPLLRVRGLMPGVGACRAILDDLQAAARVHGRTVTFLARR
jgi:hypothetical protein